MKRLFIILFIIMIVLSGCSSLGAQKENAEENALADKSASLFNYAKPLTLPQVMTAIMLEGLPFSKNQGENTQDYAINNVTPTIYTVKQNSNILMIYIYESIARFESPEKSDILPE